MIYLDSAALVKLARLEPGTRELVAWLNDRQGTPLVSSALVEVEVPRAMRRSAPEALAAVPAVLDRLYRVEIDSSIRAVAAGYSNASLRSLDAIHLATAQFMADHPPPSLSAFVTYDRRLLAIAAAAGLPVASPGLTREPDPGALG